MKPESASLPPSPSSGKSFEPFDMDYFKSPTGGAIKLTAVILNVLVNICIMVSSFRWHARGMSMYLVSVLGAFLSISLLMLYGCHFVEHTPGFPWLRFEMVYSGVLTVLYLFTSSFAVAYESALYSAAGFFGYLLMVIYGFEVFNKARSLRKGEPAQGARSSNPKQTFT